MPKCAFARANDLFLRLFCAVFDRAEIFVGEGMERKGRLVRNVTELLSGEGTLLEYPLIGQSDVRNDLQEETQMRNTKFTRTLCLILAMMTLVSGFVVSAGASGNQKYDNATSKSISDYADKLNTISYEEYMAIPDHKVLFTGEKKPVSVAMG